MSFHSRRISRRIAPALVTALIISLLEPPGLRAEQPSHPAEGGAASDRPTIALVLSGGGARGASHIGILEVFEELRIPVDYITGNSMGAIVGGYYAAGYSPQELAETITSINWVEIFRDLPKRRNLPFRRKQDNRQYRVQARLGFKDWSFQFPKGLVQGQKLDLVLQKLALPVWRIHDFDQLPLPFRCAATDIETGEAIILGDGDLATAIRASMSVPGAFAPVEIDGRLLVDGMVSNNIPIDAAKAFAPDVVIAIDIGTPPLKREQIRSAFSVSGQVLSLLMQEGTTKQLALLEPRDLLIKPDLEGISTSAFPRVGEAIERGRTAAHEWADRLAQFSVSEEEWKRYLARQRMRPHSPPIIEDIRIDDDSVLSPAVIESRIDVRTGEPLDMTQLRKNLQQIFAMDLFESVDFDLTPGNEGAVLEVRTRQKSWGTNTVRTSLEIEENFDDSHRYNLGFQVTGMPLNRLGAEWRNEFRFGSSLRVFTEFYQPFTASSQWFVSPNFTYETPKRNIYVDGQRVAEYRIRNTVVQLDVGRQLGNWGEARVGFGYVDQRISPTVGAPELRVFEGGSGAYFGLFRVDTVDSVNFPTRGIQGGLEFTGTDESLGADESFQRLKYSSSISHTWRHFTVTALSSMTSDFNDAPPIFGGELGGFLQLSGLSQGEISRPKTLFGALTVYQQLAAPSILGFVMPFYLGASVELGGGWNEWDDLEYDDMLWAGSVFFGASTFLGPFFLAYGHAEGGNNAVYLILGPRF